MLRLLNYATVLSVVSLCANPVSGAPIDYVINFTLTDSTGLISLGPGTFSFDSMGISGNAVLDPPVSLPDFQVPVVFSNPFATGGVTPFVLDLSDTFTQTSPQDDSLTIMGGLVDALNVDSLIPSDHVFGGSTLQLNLDHTWSVTVKLGTPGAPVVNGTASVDAFGTYMVVLATVPEPSTFGFSAAMLLGVVLYKRKA
jgi:hypothetical protein